MIIHAARLAASELLAKRHRAIVLKSVGLTILLFFGMWLGLETLTTSLLAPWLGTWPWLSTVTGFLLGAGILVGAGFLLAPATAIFAGLFLDDVAENVEKKHYPDDVPGKALPITVSSWLALKFTIVVIAANLFALSLVLLPGINFAIFFFVNGYLLGREYFQFAAMRFRSEKEAHQMRKKHSLYVSLAGLVIACVMAVPILNLFTPVFAANMMVHVHKQLSREYETAVTEAA